MFPKSLKYFRFPQMNTRPKPTCETWCSRRDGIIFKNPTSFFTHELKLYGAEKKEKSYSEKRRADLYINQSGLNTTLSSSSFDKTNCVVLQGNKRVGHICWMGVSDAWDSLSTTREIYGD